MSIYRPGLRGYLAFVRLPEIVSEMRTGYAPDRTAALRALVRRLRPSARLRQAQTERAYWASVADGSTS